MDLVNGKIKVGSSLRKNDRVVDLKSHQILLLYDYIKENYDRINESYGGKSIAGLSSARCTNEENYLMQKFIRAAVGTNNIDC